MKVARAKSLPSQILKALGTGIALSIILSSPIGTRRLIKGIRKEWKDRGVNTALSRLRQRGSIDFHSQKDGSLKVVLTSSGKKEARIFALDDIEFVPRKRDGLWRVIMFDIPESKKNAREALRRKLIMWGFYPLQRSIFISMYPCETEIAMLKELFGITDKDLALLTTHSPPNLLALNSHFRIH